LGRAAYLDRFFDLYVEWLHRQRQTHSRQMFRRWLEHDYCPGECRCTLVPLNVPTHLVAGEPTAFRVRAHNTGTKPWHLRPGTNAGVHIGYILIDDQDNWLEAGRSGLFEAEVAPGQSIDLALVIPGLKEGYYRVLVDMVDEQQCWFYQLGSEP